MKHKGIAFLVTVVMLVTMVPMMAFADVEDFNLISPEDPVYLRTNMGDNESVPVEFEFDADSNSNVYARVSLMKGETEISYRLRTLHLDDESWEGTINLPVKKGTIEGVYDIEIELTQDEELFAESEEGEGMIIIDNTAPTSSIETPLNMKEFATNSSITISGEAIDANIAGTETDGSGVAGVAVLITGPGGYSRTPDVDGDNDWDVEWDTPNTPGAYVISARATDEAGNVQTKATTITVYVGMDAPETYSIEMEATPNEGGTCAAITEGPYVLGAPVSISASAFSEYVFTGWSATAGAGTFANAKKLATIFTMTDDDVEEVIITAHFSLIDTDDGEDQDTQAYKAAPAIAAEILKANGISPNAKKTKGEKGENYISEVAKMMGKGSSFNGVDKSNYDEYYAEVKEYLEYLTGEEL